METRSRFKRAKLSPETEGELSPEPSTSGQDDVESEDTSPALELSLVIKWTTGLGQRTQTRINRLSLKQLESVDKLGGLSKGLMERAYAQETRPQHLFDDLHYRWTPDESCLSYPMDVTKTEFKLVVMYEGWEYVVLSHELSDREPQENKLLVTVIEFESVAVVLGSIGICVSLVAYPVVCVQKTFLDDIKYQLRTNPNYKGILST